MRYDLIGELRKEVLERDGESLAAHSFLFSGQAPREEIHMHIPRHQLQLALLHGHVLGLQLALACSLWSPSALVVDRQALPAS